jgi:hypothetical protein
MSDAGAKIILVAGPMNISSSSIPHIHDGIEVTQNKPWNARIERTFMNNIVP